MDNESPEGIIDDQGKDLSKVVQARYRAMVDGDANPHEWAHAWRSEVNRGGFKAVDFLMDEIVDTGKCVGCAACVVICPVDVFDYEDERPVDARHDACVYCELCVDVCPVLRPTDTDLETLLDYREPVVDEGFGPYSYALLASSNDAKIRDKGQDGGVVTSLLIYALEKGIIQGTIVGDVREDNPHIPVQKLATTPEEILNCIGSRYTYSPNTVALAEAVRKEIRPIAVVGVPCQIDGVRQAQYSGIYLDLAEWYRKNIAFTIGLFCSEAFTHESIDVLCKEFDLLPTDIENINVKGKVILTLKDGRELIFSLKEYQKYARPACLYCLDYAADHADIGVGGIGLTGWTFSAIRTEAGHAIFQAAIDDGWLETRPVDEEPRSKSLLIKLSEKKRNRPLPAQMPTLQERIAMGKLDPKTFYESKEG
ncbi:MAG: Coenzyme F420 hydrogenase/dehydrogenase, beta subunit C-terminal domain [Candidatus Bipolaricaulia bacterium]